MRQIPIKIPNSTGSAVDPLLWQCRPCRRTVNGVRIASPPYVKAFEDRYFAAQAKRMNELIDAVVSAQTRMKNGAYPYPDDDVVIIPSGGNPGAGPGGGGCSRPSILLSPT